MAKATPKNNLSSHTSKHDLGVGGDSYGYVGEKKASVKSDRLRSYVSDTTGGMTLNNTPDKWLPKYAQKHPFKHIEVQLIEARKKVDRLERLKEKRAEIEDEEEQRNALLQENTLMRKELKTLNDGLSQLIELMRDLKLKKKERREVPVEDRKKAREEELKNSEKISKNLLFEHNKLSQRIEQIENPMYANELRQQIRDTEEEIRKMQLAKNGLAKEQLGSKAFS